MKGVISAISNAVGRPTLHCKSRNQVSESQLWGSLPVHRIQCFVEKASTVSSLFNLILLLKQNLVVDVNLSFKF